MSEPTSTSKTDSDIYVESVHTNNLSIPVYFTGEVYYTILAGKYYTLCSKNIDYRQYVIRLINKKLNLIHEFNDKDYLCYFDNAGNADIQLVANERVLKIYLISPNSKINIPQIIKSAEKSLIDYYSKTKQITFATKN